MATEAQRAAGALMERRVERFESLHPMAESRSRLEGALSRARLEGRDVFTPTWSDADGKVLLDAAFSAPSRTRFTLMAFSVVLTLLVAGSVYVFYAPDVRQADKFSIVFLTLVAVMVMPWAAIAMGSNRLAEETRIVRAIKAALMDQEERLPPAKKWDDD